MIKPFVKILIQKTRNLPCYETISETSTVSMSVRPSNLYEIQQFLLGIDRGQLFTRLSKTGRKIAWPREEAKGNKISMGRLGSCKALMIKELLIKDRFVVGKMLSDALDTDLPGCALAFRTAFCRGTRYSLRQAVLHP